MGILDELRPENVDTSAIVFTGEGDRVEIIIVPHRDLGGVALVVWTDENSTHLEWADVGDLSTHDDLDLGVFVERIPHEGDWMPQLRDAIAAELRRPIRLKQRRGWFGGRRIDCFVVIDDKEKRLAILKPKSRENAFEPAAPELTTSLATGPALPFAISPPLENWRRYQ